MSLAYKMSHCLPANHYPELRCVICTCVTLFAPVLDLNFIIYRSGHMNMENYSSLPAKLRLQFWKREKLFVKLKMAFQALECNKPIYSING